MKLGVTLFNFHREIKTLSDLDNVLSFLKSLGTNTVQISGISHIPYADAAVLCQNTVWKFASLIIVKREYLTKPTH